jgi:hypothetical protein
MASQVSHLAAPRNGIVPENSLPGLAWRPAGQGRASGPGETSEAARPAEPLPRRTSMRDRSLSVYLYGLCIDLYSSSWANKRSALRAIWKARKTPLPTVKPQSVGPDSTRERSCAARGRRCGIGRMQTDGLGRSSANSGRWLNMATPHSSVSGLHVPRRWEVDFERARQAASRWAG